MKTKNTVSAKISKKVYKQAKEFHANSQRKFIKKMGYTELFSYLIKRGLK